MIRWLRLFLAFCVSPILIGCSTNFIHSRSSQQHYQSVDQVSQAPTTLQTDQVVSNKNASPYGYGTQNNPNGSAAIVGGFFVNTTLSSPNSLLHVSKDFGVGNNWPGVFVPKSEQWIYDSGFFLFVLRANRKLNEATVVQSFENGYDYRGARSVLFEFSLSCQKNNYKILSIKTYDDYFTFGNLRGEITEESEWRHADPRSPAFVMLRTACDQMEILDIADQY